MFAASIASPALIYRCRLGPSWKRNSSERKARVPEKDEGWRRAAASSSHFCVSQQKVPRWQEPAWLRQKLADLQILTPKLESTGDMELQLVASPTSLSVHPGGGLGKWPCFLAALRVPSVYMDASTMETASHHHNG